MKTKHYTIYSLVTTLLQEAALVAVVLWLLPDFGINIPLWGLILMIVAMGTYGYIGYRLGKSALGRKPIVSPDIGSRGHTVSAISQKGYVRIRGELWQATSTSVIDIDEEIIVVGIKGMTLLVRPVIKDKDNSGVNP